MTEAVEAVTLDVAKPEEEPLLANLLELYLHDLSVAYPSIQLGPEGRFGYKWLPRYWTEPERRFPFVIRAGGKVAGFALILRGSPVVDDPDVLDVADFFVLRGYRRSGVGRSAAHLLWDRLPGRWIVRVLEENPGAVPFWESTVTEYAGGKLSEIDKPGWRVFSFPSRT